MPAVLRRGLRTIFQAISKKIKDNYHEWLQMIRDCSNPKTVNPKGVVSSSFFAIRNTDKCIVGIIDFRHYLKEDLKDFGHIGYSVVPSERKKGYATEMLSKILEYAKLQGLKEVQLVCNTSNIASKKTIINNQGKSMKIYEHNSKLKEVFIITL